MEILGKYGIQQTFYFPLVNAADDDLSVSADYTPVAADCRISKDGGTWAQATNTIVDETEGWSITLSATEMQATRIHVNVIDAATKAVKDQSLVIHTGMGAQLEANLGIIIGEVDTATEAASTTTMEAFRLSPNLTEEATADHYNGRLILWTTGILLGQMTDITDYVLQNSKERFTFTATTEAPGDADRFVIL